jgi:transcriptional regulator with XRE-family HTH domain
MLEYLFAVQSENGIDIPSRRGIYGGMTLNDYLAETGETQTKFAKLVGASQADISRYVAGKRRPRADVLIKIYEVTGGRVTANDFFGMAERAA